MAADLKTFVKGLPAFERFGERHIDALVERLQVSTYADGHLFMSQGRQGEAVQIILRGKVDVSRHNAASNVHEEIAEASDGEIICMLALIDDMPATVTCRALGEVTSAALSRERYNELFLVAPPICHQLQYMLAVQLARDIQRLNSGLRDYVESFGDATTILPGKHWRAAS